ncbi:MAG TPA: hypothetical protein VMU59_01700 [Caulobacteraceae bacterium]|nr:hypothetical protein [Caulobacteraceae bacterium]
MKTSAKTLLATLGLITALGVAGGASAETRFQATHPARAEVNARAARLDHRIAIDRRAGRIGPVKAQAMRAELRQVRRDERLDARHFGGHITPVEHRQLNERENHVARQLTP